MSTIGGNSTLIKPKGENMLKRFLKDLWLKLQDRTGGGTKSSTNVYTPTPAPQPSTADAIKAWVESMPQVYETQMRYAPLQAAQAIDLYSQYALPLARADFEANQALYPKTHGLQETMAGQAEEGMTATEMPDWMRRQYQSDMNAQLGTNTGSPIGADYVSRGMQNQLFQQQKYYRDLGLSLAGRQPLSQATQPATTDYMSGYNPQSVMNYTQQGYGSYTQAARPLAMSKSSQAPLWGLLGSNI